MSVGDPRGRRPQGLAPIGRGERFYLRWVAAFWVCGWAVMLASGIDLDEPISVVPVGGLVVLVLAVWAARRRAAAPPQGADLLPPTEPSAGLVQRLRERIDPPRPVDPEEWIVLTVVPFSDGPMVHSAIEGAGIDAVMDEVRPLPAHGLDRQRIIVRQRDHDQALGILRDLGQLPSVDPFDSH